MGLLPYSVRLSVLVGFTRLIISRGLSKRVRARVRVRVMVRVRASSLEASRRGNVQRSVTRLMEPIHTRNSGIPGEGVPDRWDVICRGSLPEIRNSGGGFRAVFGCGFGCGG